MSFDSVNEVCKRFLLEWSDYRGPGRVTVLNSKLHLAKMALDEDVLGWMVPAKKSYTCQSHDYSLLIEGMDYCTLCGWLRLTSPEGT